MAPSVWQLLIVLLVIVLLFGTKKLRNIGSDLGSAIKGFRKGLSDDDSRDAAAVEPTQEPGRIGSNPRSEDVRAAEASRERKD